jgi:hypothetical protein
MELASSAESHNFLAESSESFAHSVDLGVSMEIEHRIQEGQYKVLSRKQLIEEQQLDIDKVRYHLGFGKLIQFLTFRKIATLLKVSSAVSRILLMHFQWNSEKLLTLFFDKGKEQVFKVQLPRFPFLS